MEETVKEKQMKDVREYLHLYLPFRFTWIRDAVPFHKGECGTMDAENLKYWDENKAPILRRLSDMTEDEAKEYVTMTLNASFMDDTEDEITIQEVDLMPLKKHGLAQHFNVVCRCFDGRLKIDHNGDTYLFDEEEKVCMIDRYARNVVWLLSKGFDLFNLIPDGLAIDKATLPPIKQ